MQSFTIIISLKEIVQKAAINERKWTQGKIGWGDNAILFDEPYTLANKIEWQIESIDNDIALLNLIIRF